MQSRKNWRGPLGQWRGGMGGHRELLTYNSPVGRKKNQVSVVKQMPMKAGKSRQRPAMGKKGSLPSLARQRMPGCNAPWELTILRELRRGKGLPRRRPAGSCAVFPVKMAEPRKSRGGAGRFFWLLAAPPDMLRGHAGAGTFPTGTAFTEEDLMLLYPWLPERP